MDSNFALQQQLLCSSLTPQDRELLLSTPNSDEEPDTENDNTAKTLARM